MKYFFFFALPLLGSAAPALAQALTNDGATLTVQSGTTLYVDGGVLNKAGSTLTNAGTVQTTGDLTNAGTLASAGTLLFTGTANQTFAPGTASVATLVQNNTGATSQNTLAIPADLTIGTALTLTSGLVRTAPAATITLPDGATLSGEATGRYVQGNLRAVRAAVSGSAPVAFPNSATLNPGGQNLGTVTITRTAGLQTAGVSYGTNLAGTTKGIDRVWAVAATGAQPSAATPATITLSWLADDDNGFNPSLPGQLWRAPSAAGPWSQQGTPGSAASRSFVADVTQLGSLTVSNVSAPLPVELTRFTAEAVGDDALLRWATASEKNNDHFDIEASADGQTFRRIGQVAGHGSTAQPQQYQLTDKAIARYAADPVYYRLRQVDADGTATYSPVRTVRASSAAGFVVYPTHVPTGQAATYRYTGPAEPATLQVLDALGRTVRSTSLDGRPEGNVPLAGLATGVYLLRYTSATASFSSRCVVE